MRTVLTFCLLLILASAATAAPTEARQLALLGSALAEGEAVGSSLVFSPDGKCIAWVTTTSNGETGKVTIHIWDLATRKERSRCIWKDENATATTPLVFAPDGKTVALGTQHYSGGPGKSNRFGRVRLRIWETQSGKEVDRFSEERGDDTGDFRSLAFSVDGKTVCTTRDLAVHTLDAATGKPLGTFGFSNMDEGGVLFEVLSMDGKVFASCMNADPIRLWDVATGKKMRELPNAGRPLTFSPDHKVLASATPNGMVLWATASGKELTRIKGIALSAVFSRDGKLVAWRDKDGKGHLCDATTGKEQVHFRAECLPLAFSPDGASLATMNKDGRIVLWKVARGTEQSSEQ